MSKVITRVLMATVLGLGGHTTSQSKPSKYPSVANTTIG